MNKCYEIKNICKNDSYWDETMNICVPKKQYVKHCEIYNTDETCAFCESGY